VSRRVASYCLLLCAPAALAMISVACGAPPPRPPLCSNGLDDDNDGKSDFPADPGCTSASDTTESPDPATPPSPPSLAPACSDTRDNDGDGRVDFPADPGCTSLTDADETNFTVGPGNAHRIILWTSYEALIVQTDDQLDLWKSRGVDGFVVQTRHLDEMGGVEIWTGDPNERLEGVIIEGADVHLKQRTLRDSKFVERCHARGLNVYLGIYLTNHHNLSTPLKVWNDNAGWNEIIPIIRGAAGAAKLLGMDGIATDSEMYRSESQTWNWDYPGVSQSEAEVRALARQRGREFMDAVLAGFPNIEIINYRIEIPGDWEERVQLQVNRVAGVWDKSVFPDFWGGIVDAGGFSAIYFLDPIFYKSWHIRSGWDEALEFNRNAVRDTLSKRWSNWAYASERFFITPFAWIDPGPSAGSFDDARPPDYVARQLEAFHKWGEGNTFGLYAQHINDFDYTPYVPAMQAASRPDGTMEPASGSADADAREISADGPPRAAGLTGGGRAIVTRSDWRIERVADGLHEPTDAAFAPDGRLFIAERRGTIRTLSDGRLDAAPDAALDDVLTTTGSQGLLALAIDPEFERTHFVFAIYIVATRSGEPAFRLARFREVQGRLGERAVLLDEPASRTPADASLRFGPDGKLYVALGGDERALRRTASYNAKILRLEPNGGTPPDQPLATPIYAVGYAAPRGLDWQPATRALWIAGGYSANAGRLRAVVSRASSAQRDEAFDVLPGVPEPTAIAFYRGDRFPTLDGSLLIGSAAGSIVRGTVDGRDGSRITAFAPMVENAGGAVRALAVSPQGAIYFCVNGEVATLVRRQ
jgi:glucose/arabinose dehydrogenase